MLPLNVGPLPGLFRRPMRIHSFATLYSPQIGAAGKWYDATAGADVSVVANDIGEGGFHVNVVAMLLAIPLTQVVR